MRPSVLVVEDETALLTLLRYHLEKEGFNVSSAHDGEEALLAKLAAEHGISQDDFGLAG